MRDVSERLDRIEEERAVVDRSNLSSMAVPLVDLTGQIEQIKKGNGAAIPPPGYFDASARTSATNASPSTPATASKGHR